MKVMFVQGAGERGGAERVLLALARNLVTADVEVVVACLVDGPFVPELESAGIETVRVPAHARMREPHKLNQVVKAITDAARSCNADVIHANGEKMGVLAGHAARIARIPCVVWLHDAPMHNASGTAVQAVLRFGPHSTFVACSPWMAAEFHRRWRLSARCIPNGIDFAPPTEVTDPRILAGWDQDTVVMTHVGRLQRWKGADVFLRAARDLAGASAAARFLVVGGALYGWEREYADSLPRLAAELGIADRVHFAGHRDDAVALMAGSDVVVHSSVRPEPFGLVVVEAMALARAVVASGAGGSADLIEDGTTGFVCAPGDVAGLAETLGRMMTDAELRERLGSAAQTAARTRFSAARMATSFASLYEEIVLRSLTRGAAA